MDKHSFVFWLVFACMFFITVMFGVYQIQTTSRKFIQSGYEQSSIPGVSGAVWKKVNKAGVMPERR